MNSLEDFEKQLIEEKNSRERKKRDHRDNDSKKSKHRHHHKSSKHHKAKQLNTAETLHVDFDKKQSDEDILNCHQRVKRDDWMEAPSAIEFDFTQRKPKKNVEAPPSHSEHLLKIHKNELNHFLTEPVIEERETGNRDMVAKDVSYTIGDAGSQWRMTKLKAVYTQAELSGTSIDEVAIQRYGDLQTFDEAREERNELDRRKTLGKGYVGKQKPNGELFRRRNTSSNVKLSPSNSNETEQWLLNPLSKEQTVKNLHIAPDATTLNRMKAHLIKARLMRAPNVASLEDEYGKAMASYKNNSETTVITLGPMESRMLAGTRAEVMRSDKKRSRVQDSLLHNEHMSIEDLVREEKRSKSQPGGEGMRAAERIAKDSNFEIDLDYMDENASKLAKRIQKSDINLKNSAISEYRKLNQILDNCQLCHHEDKNLPPIAPIVSLATRVYLSLPTQPEISEGGAVIVPLQHRLNLLECDDDEWEEIRNFMKCLIRMYHDQGRDVIFYENATAPQRKMHAAMQVVPIPYSLGKTAPAFFREAILSSDEEWTHHQKVIDTAARSHQGMGKQAFRQMIAKEMPYFHAWFDINGGLGHIVEDSYKWPKGDLFAREVIGGILDVDLDVVRKQGRWSRNDPRLPSFRETWRKFDWTRVLTDQ